MTYPPLPTFEPQAQGEPLIDFGARALQFVMEHRFASVEISDSGLEQALHCSTIAIAGEMSDPARVRLHDARTAIYKALERRKELAKAKDREAAELLAEASGEAPDGGGEPKLTDEQLMAQMFKEMMRLARNLGKDKDDPDGGKKARLQKPVPKLPSGGVALDQRPS